MEIEPFLRFLSFAVFFLIFFITYYRRTTRVVRARFNSLAASLNGRVKSVLGLNFSLGADYRGLPIQITYSPGDNNRPPSLAIAARRRPPFRFRLQKQDWNTRLSSRLGLARGFKSTDPDFDQRFFASTGDRNRCAVFLADVRNRSELEALAEAGWQVEFGRRQALIRKKLTRTPIVFREELRKRNLRNAAREIFGLSNAAADFSETELLQVLERFERLLRNLM
ncbi:MAG TPA: hypothetical protein PKN80_02375 [bacterium]|nr:hypothetical protein [bacterium]HNS48483.1 hypothetical protein [bacterium]